jgi:hypothetical protein
MSARPVVSVVPFVRTDPSAFVTPSRLYLVSDNEDSRIGHAALHEMNGDSNDFRSTPTAGLRALMAG